MLGQCHAGLLLALQWLTPLVFLLIPYGVIWIYTSRGVAHHLSKTTLLIGPHMDLPRVARISLYTQDRK